MLDAVCSRAGRIPGAVGAAEFTARVVNSAGKDGAPP